MYIYCKREQRKQAVLFPCLPPSSISPLLLFLLLLLVLSLSPFLSLFSSFSPSSTSLSAPFNRSLLSSPLLVSFLSFRCYLSSLTSYLTLFPASSTPPPPPPRPPRPRPPPYRLFTFLSAAFHHIFSSTPFCFCPCFSATCLLTLVTFLILSALSLRPVSSSSSSSSVLLSSYHLSSLSLSLSLSLLWCLHFLHSLISFSLITIQTVHVCFLGRDEFIYF